MWCSYSTEKEVVIKSVKLRIFKLSLQLLLVAYLFWVMFVKKGYQKDISGFGFSRCSMKGNAYAIEMDGDGNQSIVVFDEVNIVFPSKEHDAIFITTSYLLTAHQTRGICSSLTENCSNCEYLEESSDQWGLETGNCDMNSNRCLLYAWCPIENEIMNASNLLHNINNITLNIHTYADWFSGEYTVNNLNNQNILGYNYFRLEQDILNGAGFSTESVARIGAAIGFLIDWDCDLDKPSSECQPSFQYIRLDDWDSNISTGYNFRYANYYRLDTQSDKEYRDLFKVYGIRIIFLTNAKGRKFDIFSLLLSIASVIGMMFLASYISDLICMWILPFSFYYRNRKFLNVDEQEKGMRRMQWKSILTAEELNKALF